MPGTTTASGTLARGSTGKDQTVSGPFSVLGTRAVDHHSFYADPDPAVSLNADPDPDPGPQVQVQLNQI